MKKIFFVLIILILILVGCTDNYRYEPKVIEEKFSFPELEAGRYLPHKKHLVNRLNLAFVGDVMVHYGQIKAADVSGKDGEDSFDFRPSFRYIKDIISKADYAVCNIETTFAGADKGRNFGTRYKGYSGYPTFNTPSTLAYALKEAGFDLALLANNHTLDSRVSGINSTIDVVEKLGFDHIGTRKSAEEKTYLIKEVNGIKLAMTNYTYGMNGFGLSEDSSYAVNHLNNYDEKYIDNMLDEVKIMLRENHDYSIVFLHFGTEYSDYPSRTYQKRIVESLFNIGVDAVIGSHPHVLQKFEKIDYSGGERFVAYSLGNFISSQMSYRTKYPTDFGGVLGLELEKIDDGEVKIIDYSFDPTYCLKNSENYFILPALKLPSDFDLNTYDKGRLRNLENEVLPRISPEKFGR